MHLGPAALDEGCLLCPQVVLQVSSPKKDKSDQGLPLMPIQQA